MTNTEKSTNPPSLGACVCGDDATWYRIAVPSAPRPLPEGGGRRVSIGRITAADLDANLCGACLAQLVPEAEREAWQYVAPRRASEGSGFGPAAAGTGEECQVSPWDGTDEGAMISRSRANEGPLFRVDGLLVPQGGEHPFVPQRNLWYEN